MVLGAVPTAGLAVTAIAPLTQPSRLGIAPFTPANVDPAIARRVAAKIAARGHQMRFTPAGASPDRTVTVAIRVNAGEARAISVRSAIASAKGEVGTGPSLATIAPALPRMRAALRGPVTPAASATPHVARNPQRRGVEAAAAPALQVRP